MIESVKIRDFLSHKDTMINLENSTSVFVGNNGTGKSSVVDAITFALFGKHTRKNNKGLVRRGANIAFVQVIFTIDGTRYMASRKIAKGETSATLQKYDGKQWQAVITGERKGLGESMTNKIEEILGMDYDKLLIAGIVQQGDLASIIDEGPKKFKETLNSIIGIDKLDAAAASMGDAIKQFRTYVREKFGFDDTSIPQIEIELEKHNEDVKRLTPQVQANNEHIQMIQQKVLDLKSKLEKGRERLDAAVQLRACQEELARYCKDLKAKMSDEIKSDREKITECTKYLIVLDSVKGTASDLERIIQQEQMGRKSVQDQRDLLARLEEKMNLARSLHLSDGKCPVCDSTVSSLKPIYDEKHLGASIENAKSCTSAAEQRVADLDSEAKLMNQMMSKRDDAKAILEKYNIDSTEQINALREDTDRREQEMRGLDEQINSSAITEKIAIDARSRELYEKITNLRSKVLDSTRRNFKRYSQISRVQTKRCSLIPSSPARDLYPRAAR